jgi:hypothetical protein
MDRSKTQGETEFRNSRDQRRSGAALLPIMAAVFMAFIVIGLAIPVLPLHVHQSLGFGTFLVGIVVGSQFGAAIVSRVWAGRDADARGAKHAVIAGLVIAAAAGLLSLSFITRPAISVAVLLLGRALLDTEPGINERVTDAGQRGSDQCRRRPGRQPDKSETHCFDNCADERDLGAAKPVGHMAQEDACQDESDCEDGKGRPRRPAARNKQQGTKSGDRTEADAAQRRCRSRDPDGRHDPHKASAHARRGRNAAKWRDEQQGHERQQRRRERNSDKAVSAVDSGARRCAERKSGEHRASYPGQHLTGVLNTEEREAPTLRSRDDEAFADAEAVRSAPAQSRGLAMGAYTAFLDVALGFGIPVLGLLADLAGLGAAFIGSMVAALCAAGIAAALLYTPRAQRVPGALACS